MAAIERSEGFFANIIMTTTDPRDGDGFDFDPLYPKMLFLVDEDGVGTLLYNDGSGDATAWVPVNQELETIEVPSYNPFLPESVGQSYNTMASAIAAARRLGSKQLAFANSRRGYGATMSIPVAGTIRLTRDPDRDAAQFGAPFDVDMIGTKIYVDGATTLANNINATITDADPDGMWVEYPNAAGVAEDYTGPWCVVGNATTTSVIIPGGGARYDVTGLELVARANPGAQIPNLNINVEFTNAYLDGFRELGGDISLISKNTVAPPCVIADSVLIDIGSGEAGDYCALQNSGSVAFFDCSLMPQFSVALGLKSVSVRCAGDIRGTYPVFDFGAGAGDLNLQMLAHAKLRSGMVIGTNALARITGGDIDPTAEIGRQDLVSAPYAGSIQLGAQSGTLDTTGIGTNIPRHRWQMFPISLNQAAPVVSAAAFTNATGLGHNGNYEIVKDTVVAQTLPVIRGATSLAVNLTGTTAGVLNSTGMQTIFKHRDAGGGTGGITLSPSGAETINGVAGSISIPPNGAALCISDGVSNWRVYIIDCGPAAPAMTITNPVTLRAYDTTTVTTEQLAQFVGTMYADLKKKGLYA